MTITDTPKPPYFAVSITAIASDNLDGYAEMAEQMRVLAEQQEGFLGLESVGTNFEITISYWTSLEAVKAWNQNAGHQLAAKYGRGQWYKYYKIRISEVVRDYGQLS